MNAQNSIEFKKIEIGTIFDHDFRNFLRNNVISFSDQGIAVIYGPNGAGKTSFINVLDGKKGSSFIAEYEGTTYSSNDNGLFYIINDQNHRNIITGTAKDFFIATNIQREFELSGEIEKSRGSFIWIVNSKSDRFYKVRALLNSAGDKYPSVPCKRMLLNQ